MAGNAGTEAIAVALCVVGAALMAWVAWNLFVPGAGLGRNDFIMLYTGGRLAGSSALYEPAAVIETQSRELGFYGKTLMFNRLPYVALLMWPLGQLPYSIAYACWEVCSLIALAGSVLVWDRKQRLTMCFVMCWSLPVFVGLFNGQDVAFLLLYLAIVFWCVRAGKEFLGGLALSLCAAKFHFFLLAPLVLVGQKRWRLVLGLALGGCVLAALSFLAAGPDWPDRYWSLIGNPAIDASVEHMPSFRALFLRYPGRGWLELAASAVVAGSIWLIAVRTRRFEAAMAAAVAAGILTGHHAYVHDCALLAPALVSGWESQDRLVRHVSLALASPVPYFLLQLPPPCPALTIGLIVVLVLAMLRDALARGRPSEPRLGIPLD